MFADKLKSLRKSKGNMSQADLANALGVSQQAVGRWEKNLNMPDNSLWVKIADYFHVSTDYLFGRETGLFELNEKKRVPVIGSVRCGAGGPAYEYIDEYIAVDDSYRADEMRGFRAEGDSMEPVILDGDICLVHLQAEVPDGAIAVVVIDGEEGTIKCVHVDRERGVITLQPKNPRHETRYFFGPDGSKVHVVGQVVEIRRKTV